MPIGPRPVDQSSYGSRTTKKKSARRLAASSAVHDLGADEVEIESAVVDHETQVTSRENPQDHEHRPPKPPPPRDQPTAKQAGLSIPLGGEHLNARAPKRASSGFTPPVTGVLAFVRNTTTGTYGAGRGATPNADRIRAETARAAGRPHALETALTQRLVEKQFGHLPGIGRPATPPPLAARTTSPVLPPPTAAFVPAAAYGTAAAPHAYQRATPTRRSVEALGFGSPQSDLAALFAESQAARASVPASPPQKKQRIGFPGIAPKIPPPAPASLIQSVKG